MKYGKVDAAAHSLTIIEADTFEAAKEACGLEPMKTDHGNITHTHMLGGIEIVVAEFGLFMPPLNQHYFAIGGRLYAGNALLYAYGGDGHTVQFDDPALVTVRWFESGYDVASAITRGEIKRPQMVLNGAVVWEWPQPRPDLQHLSRRIGGA